jgi:phosphoribosylformimino-5-aminoimidazole carboxamide ribotide isomerase
MLILPAIDLLNGNAVRLKQGVENTAKIYSNDPQEMALKWAQLDAEIIHVVNLDGAFGRENKNTDAIRKIVDAVEIPIELGGGIRSLEEAGKWLELGVHRVILGTIALTDPKIVEKAVSEFGAEKVVIGIDGRKDKVAIRGWEEQTETTVLNLALKMKEMGATRIIYTDVFRDGELVGPNFESTDELAKDADMKVIASGGFSTVEHFEQLQSMANPNIEGAIVGTAIYEGKIELKELTTKFRSKQEA